ncbi:flagellin [Halohasta litorea]|uniref:Flagellar protein FlaF n=1 Tax=Halohasta litorea TaxID=869891 RepID=A0ABD6D3I4_9EURY|nr:flagellin [Halohasta litorea]
MGFSVSASTAIIFAGVFLAIGVLYPAVSNGYERVTDAEIDRDDAHLDMRNTDINITSVSSSAITVRNEGSTSLDADEIDLVVDGEYRPRDDYTTSVDSDPDTGLWLPGESLTIDGLSASNRIKLVTDHGVSVTGVV